MTNKKTNNLRKHLTTYMLIAVLIVTSLIAGLGVMLGNNKTSSASAAESDIIVNPDVATLSIDIVDGVLSFTAFSAPKYSGASRFSCFISCRKPDGTSSTGVFTPTAFDIITGLYIFPASQYFIFSQGGQYEFYIELIYMNAYPPKNFKVRSNTVTYTAPSPIPLPEDPTKAGHTFKGWYLDEACTVPYDGRPIYADTALYAGFTINTYSVAFNTNGGNSIPSIAAYYNTSPTMPTNPTKTGYTFKGWFFDSAFTAPYVDFAIKTHVTFFAKWEINTYTIAFHTNGGNGIDSVITNYNIVPTMPANPIKNGYTFKGWYTDIGLTNAYTNAAITTNYNLHAKFVINTYTLTFDANGGEALESATYDWNTNISVFPTPSRTGYNFKGWTYNGVSFTSGVITSNMTLAATWEAIIYKVTFKVDGETYKTLDVPYGTTLKDIAKEQNISIYNAFMSADGKSLSKDTIITGDSAFSLVEMTDGEKFMEFCKTYWVVPLIVGLLLVGGIITLVIVVKKKRG